MLDADGFHNPKGAVALNDVGFDDGTTLASDLIDVADLQVNDLFVGAEIREGVVTGTEGVRSPDSVRMTTAFPAGEVAASTLASVFADVGEPTTDATACLINPAQRCASPGRSTAYRERITSSSVSRAGPPDVEDSDRRLRTDGWTPTDAREAATRL